jgi:hypothetical protein
MHGRDSSAAVLAVLAAALLAIPMGLAFSSMPLVLALGVGVLLVVVVMALASTQLALYLLIFSMLLGPQIVAGGLGEGTTLGRGLTLRLDDLLLVIIGVAWLAKTALQKELGLVFRTPLNAPIAAYSVAAVVATGFGILAGRVNVLGGLFFTLKYIQYFVIYFMVVNNLRERRQFERLLWAILATAAIVSLIGILQIPSGQRVSAPFEGAEGEPNTFGGYLVLMIALASGLFLTSRSIRVKGVMALLVGWMLLPLLFTLSRASYLALIPLLGALFVLSDKKRLLAGTVTVTLAVGPFVAPAVVTDRILFTFTQPQEAGQKQIGNVRIDTSTSARLESWERVILTDWLAQPLVGYGVTGYRFIDAQYARTLAETGLVGFVAFLWLQAGLFREVYRVLRGTRDPLYRGVALGFFAGLVALVTHSVGANTFIIVRVMEPFWFLAGMVIMIPQLQTAADPAPPAPQPWRRGPAPARPLAGAGGARSA